MGISLTAVSDKGAALDLPPFFTRKRWTKKPVIIILKESEKLMKAVIQRVTQASVIADGVLTGEIGRGYMILLGVAQGDTDNDCEKLADKICKLRIFADENGKTNLSINDVGGDMLIVSQFTLLADCHHGNRPSFINAGSPDEANRLYELFCGKCAEKIGGKIAKGVFGADMSVSLVNDGPFTIYIECKNGEILA